MVSDPPTGWTHDHGPTNVEAMVKRISTKKREETGKNGGENGRKWKEQEKICRKTGRNRKKLEETGRNKKKQEEAGRNRKKHEETGRNKKKVKKW